MRIPKQHAVREILCSRIKLSTSRFFNGSNSDCSGKGWVCGPWHRVLVMLLCHSDRFSNIYRFLKPGNMWMCQWIKSSLVQVMPCHLHGIKPLPEPEWWHCKMKPFKLIFVKFESKYNHVKRFLFKKMHFKMSSAECQPSCSSQCVKSWEL